MRYREVWSVVLGRHLDVLVRAVVMGNALLLVTAEARVAEKQLAADSPLLRAALIKEIELLPKENSVFALNFSPDGGLLAVGGRLSITLWDTNRWSPIKSVDGVGHNLRFSSCGKALAVLSSDRIKVFDVPNLQQRREFADSRGFQAVAIASLDRPLVAYQYWYLVFLNLNSGEEEGRLDLPGSAGWTRLVVYSPDGQTLAATYRGEGEAGKDGAVALVDAATRRVRRTFIPTGRVGELVFSPDGRLIATSEQCAPSPRGDGPPVVGDLVVELWEVRSGKRLEPEGKVAGPGRHTMMHGMASVGDVSFSSDSRMLASTNYDTFKVWDVRSQRALLTVRQSGLRHVAFSPKGLLLATVTNVHSIKPRESHEGTPRPAIKLQIWDIGKLLELLKDEKANAKGQSQELRP